MAKKIGKFKIGPRESALSAVDGATITGNLTNITNLSGDGTFTWKGSAIMSGSTTFANEVTQSYQSKMIKFNNLNTTSESAALTTGQIFMTSSVDFHNYSGSDLQILCVAR